MGRGARIATALFAVLVVGGLIVAGVFLWRPAGPQEPRRQAPKAAVWPLTGEDADSGAATSARIVAVKVENSRQARPQAGLADADVVYEIITEGGITRFHALFHSTSPERVGPVRSARLPDIPIVQQFGSVLLYSGANEVVEGRIEESGIDALNETTGGRALTRSTERRAPHNLYADIGVLREVAEERGLETQQEAPRLSFGEAPAEEGTAAAEADVPFNRANRVVWRWDSGAKRYARELNGEPQVDDGSGAPWQAANVVVLFAEVVEGQRQGTADLTLDAEGEAIVFRDGARFDARWSASSAEPPRFTTEGGEDLPFAVGPTWIEVLPSERRAQFE